MNVVASAVSACRSLKPLCLLCLVLLVALSTACSSTLEEREQQGKPFPLPDYENKVAIKKLWSRGIGDGQGKQYARIALGVSDNTLCAASVDGVVACYDSDGRKQWRVSLDEKLLAGTTVDEQQLLIANADGWLVALDRETGKELWRKNLQSEILAAPAAMDDRIVVQNSEGLVFGLSAEGEKVWEYRSDEPLLTLRGTAAPVIRGDLVYCGFANGKIVALALENGTPVWDQPVAIASGTAEVERLVDVDASPLLTEQALFAASYNGNLFMFDRRDGRPRWRTEISSYRGLARGFGSIYAVDEQGRVLAVNEQDGEQRWENGLLLNRGISDPVVHGGYLLIVDDKGYMHVFSQVDGSLIGRAKVAGAGVRVPMISDHDKLYLYSNDGRLLALELRAL